MGEGIYGTVREGDYRSARHDDRARAVVDRPSPPTASSLRERHRAHRQRAITGFSPSVAGRHVDRSRARPTSAPTPARSMTSSCSAGGDRARRPESARCHSAWQSGRALESAAIRATAEARCPLVDITTGTGDFIANGVVSHNCFARPTHTYLDFNAGRDFEREIVVKVNAPGGAAGGAGAALVEARTRRARHQHRPLPVGREPLPADGRHLGGAARRREPLLGAHEVAAAVARPRADAGNRRADRASARACRSPRSTRRHGGKPSRTRRPAARLEAVAELNRAGIPTGVLIAPLMPGINDSPTQLEPLLERPTRRVRRASAASPCTCAARSARCSWSG